ncbi:MAG: type IV pilus twitching motility protein PilT [Candidatus Gastranaerophilales bacterium]|nr:type IV pilus twitching motility protein PilT [Candidatus Gastranaerophilales bacterium]
MVIDELLELVIDNNASDLHLSVGLPPIIRVHGELLKTELPDLTAQDVEQLVFSMLTAEQRRYLEQHLELDCSYGIFGLGRFRVNIYKERGTYAAALRTVASVTPTIEQLGLPTIVKDLTRKPRGLILVTGPTGSGKSTTLAAMIDSINTSHACHILTIEDPIEFVHNSKKALVHQRELGADTKTFANALRASLREDPDVILIGEMRDLETIQLAITAAETGHLVFGTLHTSSAIQTIDRIVDAFPPGQQQQIRVQLSTSLVAVLAQTLLPKRTPEGRQDGRILAQEIMIVTPAIANLIRESKTIQMYSSIQTGAQHGMITLEASLKNLYDRKLIAYEDAMMVTSRPDDLAKLLGYNT